MLRIQARLPYRRATTNTAYVPIERVLRGSLMSLGTKIHQPYRYLTSMSQEQLQTEHQDDVQMHEVPQPLVRREIGGKVLIRQGRVLTTISLNRPERDRDTTHINGADPVESAHSDTPKMSIVRSFPWMTKRYSAIDGRRNRSVAEWFRGSTKKVLEAFLPAEYKTSVTPEYMSYMKWQFVHNTLGAASGVLSTQALLYAMGLGTGALPLSAAINWVIKDGFGQLGGVLYATMVGQKFDSDPKHLRFWSAVWLQSATWLEMLAPLAPHLFILIGSAANVGKNISWLAMSATKASINKSFCLKENLGDLTAKHGSQATAAGLLGTAAGILIGATMDITIYTLIIGFVPISLLSLWGNYKSLLCTITPSLNLERASHMVSEAVSVDPHGQLALDPYMLKSPRQVSEVERFMRETRHISPNGMLPGIALLPDIGKIHRELPDDVGAEHKQAIVAEMVSSAFCPQTTDRTWSENYYIGYLAGSTANKSRNGNIYLWFSTQATSRDMLFGLYHSIALRQLLGQAPGIGDADAVAELSDQAYHFARHSFADFGESLIIKGWDISTVYLAKRSDLVQVGVSKN